MGHAIGDETGAFEAGLIQLAGEDEHGCRDPTQPVVERRHGSLARTTKRGSQSARVVAQALGALLRLDLVGQRGMTGEQGQCFPALDEGRRAIALEIGGESVVGSPALGAKGRSVSGGSYSESAPRTATNGAELA